MFLNGITIQLPVILILLMNSENTHNIIGSRLKSFFRDVTEAVSGTEQDFTEGKLSRAILLLSIPAVLEMVMESVFVIVDIIFCIQTRCQCSCNCRYDGIDCNNNICNCYWSGDSHNINGFAKDR